MRLGIIGPTQWQKNCKIVKIKEKKYFAEIKKIAATVKAAGLEIAVNPHKGSSCYFFAKEFKAFGGKVFGIVPLQDKEFGIDYLDQSVCDEIIDCNNWRNMAPCLNENCSAFLCIGFSPGTLNEIAFSKWFNLEKSKLKKILVVEDFVSARLPKESIKGLDIEYVSLKQLGKKMLSLGEKK